MSRRAVLWIAFALVHLGVAWLGFLLPNQPMGDVYNVYEPWSLQALERARHRRHHRVVGVPSARARADGPRARLRVDRGLRRRRGRSSSPCAMRSPSPCSSGARDRPAGGWAAGTGSRSSPCSGPSACTAWTAITVPLALAGSLWLVGRPWLGSALLAGGHVDQGVAGGADRGGADRGAPADADPRRSGRRLGRDHRGRGRGGRGAGTCSAS